MSFILSISFSTFLCIITPFSNSVKDTYTFGPGGPLGHAILSLIFSLFFTRRLKCSFVKAFFHDLARDSTKLRPATTPLTCSPLGYAARRTCLALFVYEYRGTNDVPILIFPASVLNIYLQTHLSGHTIYHPPNAF